MHRPYKNVSIFFSFDGNIIATSFKSVLILRYIVYFLFFCFNHTFSRMLLTSRSSIFVSFVVLISVMTFMYVFVNLTVLVHRQPQNDGLSESTNVRGVEYTEAAGIQHQRWTRAHRVCENIIGLKPVNILKDQLRFPVTDHEKVWLRLTYFVDDRKVAFVLVLKAGFSNWLDFISSILTEGKAECREGSGLPFTLDEIRPKLRTYKKVIFVRNPISRLVSGYVDKFVNLPTEYYTNMSRDIIKEVRGEAIAKSRRPDMTFPEFLHYILTTKEILDAHWLPIHEQKVPCDIDYDFIGKVETVSRDIEYMKSLYNISKSAVYKQSYISNTKRTELMVNYYRNITTETIEKVIQKYKYDFLIFGYPLPKDASNILEYIKNDMKADDFYIASD
ncbi:carbohydrate sulfotransferase 11-like [Asterias rubens]|uniref:carbohydrate sulfotransferase 11-like n=1 Tax=Asterias rubens TaxID=7604 RepID=UPI001454FBBD|nr:carbohydrate sulfotransferase 11-like [Asterias rubens]